MKIYIDACCYGRPFDNKAHMAQERVRRDVGALIDALDICVIAGFPIAGSPMVKMEINRIPDGEKRLMVMGFYDAVATEKIPLSEAVDARAAALMAQNIKGFDAYHVALAEAAGADYLLTVDVRLLNARKRLNFAVDVVSPLTFMEEYKKWRRY